MASFDAMLREMLAVSDQKELRSLASDILYIHSKPVPNNHPGATWDDMVEQFGSLVANRRLQLMEHCYLELLSDKPDQLKGSVEPGAAKECLVTAFKRKYGPVGQGVPVPVDANIINPFPGEQIYLSLDEAREHDLWCDWHEQAREQWGAAGVNAICRQCLEFMQASLTSRQWHKLNHAWLDYMTPEEQSFYVEVVEEWSESEIDRYLSSMICAQALIKNMTPHQVVDQLRLESIIRNASDATVTE